MIVLQRPGHAWPLLFAANRDERLDRAWDRPGRYWPDRPGVVAGRDRLGGGTWMGVNNDGVVAAVLNRPGSLGPAEGKASRGELPLLALDCSDAAAAAAAIAALDAGRYRTFNMVIADRTQALFVRGLGHGRPDCFVLSPWLAHMVTAADADDFSSARTARWLPAFRAAPAEAAVWREMLADGSGPAGSELNVPARDGFGTVCSSVVAVPAEGEPVWWFGAVGLGGAGSERVLW